MSAANQQAEGTFARAWGAESPPRSAGNEHPAGWLFNRENLALRENNSPSSCVSPAAVAVANCLTSAGLKLRISKGDIKSVQGDGGWTTPDMVTKRYADILDEDRQILAAEMEKKFYQAAIDAGAAKLSVDASAITAMLKENPELLRQVLQSVQLPPAEGGEN